MRAYYPDRDGYVEVNGVKTFYEVFGSCERTVLFLPTWSIVHSRYWKMQVPYFARYARVVAFDPRGNGRSDRPTGPERYAPAEFAADALAVMDAVGVERASIVALSNGAKPALLLAAGHADRVEAIVFNCPALAIGEPLPDRTYDFHEPLDTDEGWAKFNAHYWRRDYRGFLEFFFSRNFNEPHSTKPFEDALGWASETTPEVLIDTIVGSRIGFGRKEVLELCSRVRCPILVIQGAHDDITGPGPGIALAEATDGKLLLLEGSGHSPHTRAPVKFNLVAREFLGLRTPERSWTRWTHRRRRALFVSSPIGLGHARRDVAIADELRKLHPDLEIAWLAQDPVTHVLRDRGERIHPASRFLASEVAHVDAESGEHALHCFQMLRRMDEIMLANFMIFHDVVENEHYDLWIGDEAWEIDHYLHENPELKRAPYVWLTDFVGALPMPDGGEYEAFLTSDWNAEMIEHVERFPRIRDRAILVGNADDIVSDRFGPGLPLIRDWTVEHYKFSGYITGFDPSEFKDRSVLRASLGYQADERVCIVTAGGSGAGGSLLRRVVESFPEAKRRVPELRMVVVAGPRIHAAAFPSREGLEIQGYVPGLHRHLSACEMAVVQGGLATTMELTAAGRPFVYVPLRHHFEQNFHVRHRLDRYEAGRCMTFDQVTPDAVAQAFVEGIDWVPHYRPVETDGAARAAAMIAELL